MLEQLFSSKTRVKLLKLFLDDREGRNYYVRELSRILQEHLNSVRRELANLEELGLVFSLEKDKKKFYSVNNDFVLLPELKALLLKSRDLGEQKIVAQIEKTGKIDLLVLKGAFVGDKDSAIDLFIVGNVVRPKLEKIAQQFQRDSGRELNYTVLGRKEFQDRVELGDRFVFTVMNGKKIVVINKIGAT